LSERIGRTWRWKFIGGPLLLELVAARKNPPMNKAEQTSKVLRGKLHMMPLNNQ
jgi:hypothetical protein